MGCDIHFYVEKREGDKWVSADKWTPNKYHQDDPDYEPEMVIDYDDRFYNNRNYDLFSILADVRNGYGFAGCDTGNGFKPIAMPRGLPDDVTTEVNAESARMDGDGHSHSWFTVKELLEYDWTQTTKKRGWVNAIEYYHWRQYGMRHGDGPDSYSGGVGGTQVTHITREEMERRITEIEDGYRASGVGGWGNQARKDVERLYSNYYCSVEWETPYYKQTKDFWAETMPRLLMLGNYEDVRIVFWFDN